MPRTKKIIELPIINTTEYQTLRSIEESHFGSACGHGKNVSCSVESISFNPEEYVNELGLDKDLLMKALRNMLQARLTDEKHLMFVRQGKSFFHIGCSGHETLQTAVGMAMKPSYDWAWCYYRDMAFVYSWGVIPKEYFLLAFGKAEDPATGGRQMPGHYGHPKLNIPTQSSSTGTQYLNAVGCALASKNNGVDEVTYVTSGEGTTSQGEFYEAVNWATREKLPVLFVIQDNGYAISVPREQQSMGSTVGHSFCCYSNLKMKTFDGTDFLASYKAAVGAVEHIRLGKGPVLLHAMVERLLPHSSSDDQKKYRPEEEMLLMKSRDGIEKFKNYLIKSKISNEKEISHLESEIKKEISDAADWALTRPDPKAEDSIKQVFSIPDNKIKYSPSLEQQDGNKIVNKIVLVDAINHALFEEMKFNNKMIIFGEDVADLKGGVFTATKGLSTKFGSERVFNSPLAEASIIGVALGLAVRGYKPVVEIQFGDYIWPAMMQLKNEIATMRYRSNGGFSAPVVVRVAVGGYIHGGLCHSQNIESIFSHVPGLMIAYPSNAADAKGLLKSACRMNDPVIFCEHKGMYRLPFATSIEPDENYLLEFGKGNIIKEGTDATIVTYGMGVRDSVNCVRLYEKEYNKSIEIIDLRTIIPWDKELVLNSVKKTGRLLVFHEDTLTTGFGAEIAATVGQELFNYLDAPIMRLAAKDSHIPYAPVYEEDVLPNEKKVRDMLDKLMGF